MKCNQIRIRLADYSARRLAAPEADQVRNHLNDCSRCAAFLQEEAALTQGLSRLALAEPREDLWAKVAVGLNQPQRSRRGSRWTMREFTRPFAVLGTGLALIAGLATYNHETAPPAATEVASVMPGDRTIISPSTKFNQEVDDPLADQMDSLLTAVDHATQ